MRPHKEFDNVLQHQVREFLHHESALLDDRLLKEWLAECVDEQIRYVVPLRFTQMKEDGDGFNFGAPLQDDDWNAMTMRVNRFDSKAAWSENPPTRYRHFITNVRIGTVSPGETQSSFDVEVKSNVLLYRTRGESHSHDLLSAERHDVLRFRDGDVRLKCRTVLGDFATVGTHNLSFIF